MRVDRLADMHRGWFVGDFEPTLHRTDAVEVAVKHYAAGDAEARHVHRVATEITAVVSGTVRMDGREIGDGSVVTLDPGVPSDFLAVTDAVVVTVKLPAVPGDKYLVEEETPC